jgi:hypothetical protein
MYHEVERRRLQLLDAFPKADPDGTAMRVGPLALMGVLLQVEQLRAANASLRRAIELAITHIDGQAAKFSERESVAVLSQLRQVLATEHMR